MSKRDAELLITDILAAADKIEFYIDGRTFDAFEKDEKTIDAVVRNLEIIGEAANHLPKSAKQKSPDLKWNRIVGLRNRIIHEYFGVDINIIWRVIQSDLPLLKEELLNLKNRL